MNTRKFPRTLQEAFGPYSRGPISEPADPRAWQDKLVAIGLAVAFVAALIIVNWS